LKLKNAFRRMSTAAAVAALSIAAAGSLKAQNTFLVSTSALTFSYQFGAVNAPAGQDINILSSGPNVQFTVTPTTNGGGQWLSGFQLQNTTPATYRASVFTNGLQPATYTGNLAISAPGFTTVNIPVTFRVTTTSELSFTPSTTLAFTAAAGSGIQTKSLVVGSSGSPLTYQAASSTQSGGPWLAITPASGTTESPTGTITVVATPGNLGVGTYSGFISAQSPGASNTQGAAAITVGVTLTIVAAPQITAIPSALTFNFQTGGATPAAQTLTIGSSAAGAALGFSTAIDTGNIPVWLTVTPIGGTTPAQLAVTVNPAGLTPNTYAGKITITSPGASGPLIVLVTFVVSNLPLLSVQPSSLLFTAQTGQSPPTQILSLTSTGTSLPFSVTPAVSTPAAGGWLFVSPLAGTASNVASQIAVAVNPSGLPAGSYNGTLTIASPGSGNPTQTINVTLVVSAAVTLSLSTNTLTYVAQSGGLPPATQTFNIASSDNSPIPFIISTSTSDGGKWVSVSPASGTTPVQGVIVSINQAGLAPGNYTGTITVTGSGIASATTQTIAVNLTVSTQAYTAVPTSLTFTQLVNGAAPPSQTVQISSATAGATFQVSAISTNNWLSVTQSTAITPGTLTVNANGATLTPGTYSGQISIIGSAGQSLIPVTLTVSNTPPLTLAPTALTFNFQTGSASPAAQGIAVTTSGTALNFTTSAATSSGGSWLAVTPASGSTPSQLSVTVNPSGLAAGTYSGTITVTPSGAGAGPAAVTTVSLIVAAPSAPSLTAFVNAASYAPGPAVPGMIVALFGTGMGPSTITSAGLTGGFFDTKVADTRVLFDGVAAPMIYTSAGQVAAIVPYTLYGRLSTTAQVEYLGVRSNSLVLRVDNALPGLFSANASGRGQGAILNQDNSANSVNNPATKTQAIVLYATGEGQTTPAGIDGKIIGSDLKKSLLPVSVKVGGVDCTVEYAGSAPSLVSGVFQVNVRLNSAVPSGNVPVVLTVGNVSSQDGLTAAIR